MHGGKGGRREQALQFQVMEPAKANLQHLKVMFQNGTFLFQYILIFKKYLYVICVCDYNSPENALVPW